MNTFIEETANSNKIDENDDILNYYEAGAYIGLFVINILLFLLQINSIF